MSHIFSSPFLRTAESALEMRSSLVAQSSTDLKLKVETSISELAAKAFFKSFGVKGHSTGKWGGSHAVRSMKAKELDALMIEQVHHGVSKLHNSANDLGGKLGDEAFDHAYAPFHDDTKADYTYNNPEHHRQVHTRLDRFVQHVLAAYENETVLCVSHGGIVAMGHYVVTKEQEYLHTGYSCVSIYSHHKTDDAFRPIVVASDQHLENVGSGKGEFISSFVYHNMTPTM